MLAVSLSLTLVVVAWIISRPLFEIANALIKILEKVESASGIPEILNRSLSISKRKLVLIGDDYINPDYVTKITYGGGPCTIHMVDGHEVVSSERIWDIVRALDQEITASVQE